MKIHPLKPPRDENQIKEAGFQLLKTAQALGIEFDAQGFLHAWLQPNMRVYVAEDNGEPRGLGVMVYGQKWHDSEVSATVLLCEGPARQDILRDMAAAAGVLGAVKLYVETKPGDHFTQPHKLLTVAEVEV